MKHECKACIKDMGEDQLMREIESKLHLLELQQQQKEAEDASEFNEYPGMPKSRWVKLKRSIKKILKRLYPGFTIDDFICRL